MRPASPQPQGGVFWLASYPKSGNTWTRSLITSLRGGSVELNELADISPNSGNRGWIESWLQVSTEELTPGELGQARIAASLAFAAASTPPPCIKVHDRNDRHLFPPAATRGVVHIVRDPRDVAPSWAAHMGRTIDEAIAVMARPDFTLSRLSRHTQQVPQHLGSWSDHVASWLDFPPGPMLLLRYEDMLADPIGETTRLADFLGLDAGAAATAAAACRFDALRAAEDSLDKFNERPEPLERFFRQGRAGTWRTALSREQADRIVANHGTVMRRLGYL